MELSFAPAGKENAFQPPAGDRGTDLGRDPRWLLYSLQSEVCEERGLKRHDPVNTIRPEDAELAFIVTAKVNEAVATLAGAG